MKYYTNTGETSSSDEDYDPLIGSSFQFLAAEDESSSNDLTTSEDSTDSSEFDDHCYFEENDSFPTISPMDSSSEDDAMDLDTEENQIQFTPEPRLCSTPIQQSMDYLSLSPAPNSEEDKTPEVFRATSTFLGNDEVHLASTISVMINPLVRTSPTLSEFFLQRLSETEEEARIYRTGNNMTFSVHSASAPEPNGNNNTATCFIGTGSGAPVSSIDVDLFCYENFPPSP